MEFKGFLNHRSCKSPLTRVGVLLLVLALILMAVTFGVTYGTLFLVCLGVFFLVWSLVQSWGEGRDSSRMARVALRVLKVTFFLWLASFVVVQMLVISCLRASTDAEVNYVIVLGAAVLEDQPSQTLTARLEKAIEYLERNPHATVIVSGGKGEGETHSEAEVMKAFLLANHVSEGRITMESAATNTRENIVFAGRLMGAESSGNFNEVVIVTSDYHLYRAKRLARQHGMVSHGIAADSPAFVLINYLIREYFAVSILHLSILLGVH